MLHGMKSKRMDLSLLFSVLQKDLHEDTSACMLTDLKRALQTQTKNNAPCTLLFIQCHRIDALRKAPEVQIGAFIANRAN
jgi:hypothetical protein